MTEKEAQKGLSSLEKRFEKCWREIFGDEVDFIRQAKPFPPALLPGNKRKSAFVYDYQCGKVLVECQGGVFGKTLKPGKNTYIRMMGHNSPKGLTRDHMKANKASVNGFYPFFISEKLVTEYHMHQLMRLIQVYG